MTFFAYSIISRVYYWDYCSRGISNLFSAQNCYESEFIMKTLIEKQIISVDDVFEHVHTNATFKVVAFDMVESSFTFKVEMIENKNNVEHYDGVGATLKRVGDRLWINNYYGGVGGVANLISDGTKSNTIVAEALVEVN